MLPAGSSRMDASGFPCTGAALSVSGTQVELTICFFGEKISKSRHCPMPTGYTFNAPEEKYGGLGELSLNLCGDTRQYCDTSKIIKKQMTVHNRSLHRTRELSCNLPPN